AALAARDGCAQVVGSILSPGGASVGSQGWSAAQTLGHGPTSSPALEGRQSLSPLRGSGPGAAGVQGLAPLATDCRPSGAEIGHRLTALFLTALQVPPPPAPVATAAAPPGAASGGVRGNVPA